MTKPVQKGDQKVGQKVVPKTIRMVCLCIHMIRDVRPQRWYLLIRSWDTHFGHFLDHFLVIFDPNSVQNGPKRGPENDYHGVFVRSYDM